MTAVNTKNTLGRWLVPVAVLSAALLCACGGGGGGGGSSSGGSTATTPTQPATLANTVPIVIDAGPAALTNAGAIAANQLFVTITVCTPGSTTACKSIDHVQVDTGSTGLRLISSVLGTAVPTPVIDATSGRPLLECVQFADGYSFGSVGALDVTIGPRTIPSLSTQVIGDPAAGNAPSGCISGPAENTVAAFGSNGILGIGNFIQDCGPACANRAVAGFYYVCPASGGAAGCTATAVAVARQITNPVSLLTADNNGVVVQLPAVAEPGTTLVNGSLLFGVGTQTDNALGSARVFQLSTSGTFTTTFNGASITGSFIDSGSNAYFFASSIRVCPDATFFYCPVTSGGATTTVSQTATINGTNGVNATITFNVANADTLFASSNTAFPSLGGPNGSLINGTSGAFDFGLPFFFGRSVYVIIEGNTVAGVTAPAIAF
jgi:hypothetical protein